MRQRIARATKSVAVVAAAAATVIATRTPSAGTSADAFCSPEASQHGKSHRTIAHHPPLDMYSAFAAVSRSSTHRSACDTSAAPPPSSWSFLPSFAQKESSAASLDDDPSLEPVDTPDRCSAKQHALFGTLAGDTMIESYKVYRPTNTAVRASNDGRHLVLVGVVEFGTHLNGHGGVVHGGILGLVFDDIMGWACNELMESSSSSSSSSQPKICVTANLNVDFRKPVVEGSRVTIKVYLDRQEGRKYFWKAEMMGVGDDGKEFLCAEATSLYILLRDTT